MSKRYTGGIVSATKPTTTSGETGSASGMWEIEQQGRLQAAGLWPSPYVPKYVEEVFSTYLHTGNGNSLGNDIPNGIQFGGVPTNGTILHLTGDALSDSAPVPCPVTSSGVSVNTSTKKYGTGSLYYNVSTSILTASSAGLRVGTGDFTVECWVYATNTGNQGVFHLGGDWGQGCAFVSMYPSNQFQWGWDGSYTGGVGSFPSNTWIHVALVRQSGVLRLYVNGIKTGSDNTFGGSINLGRIWVGNYYDSNYGINGYIDDLRVSNKAVYTANFTPPAQALPLDTLVAGSNYGGMTWIKCRSQAYNPVLFDTLRGGTNTLRTSTIDGNRTDGGSIAFNTSGWCVNTTNAGFNAVNDTYASWSFRRQPKFFDVVTYTGTGVARTVAHNLGSVPGCVIVKRTDTTGQWAVYHRGQTSAAYYTFLNATSAEAVSAGVWNSTAPTATEFSVGTNANTNANGGTYVAYIFAHDAGGFGTTGTDNVISCGSFTTNSSGTASVNLGYEPQWVLFKASSASSNWYILDNMRGLDAVKDQGNALAPNLANAEFTFDPLLINPTGFNVDTAPNPNTTYIYVAIRRGPMRTPTNGTSVYYGLSRSGTSTNVTVSGSPFPVDLAIIKNRFNNDAFASNSFVFDRVRGSLNALLANATDAASPAYTGSLTGFDVQNGYRLGIETSGWVNWAGSSGGALYMNWMFRRAPGVLDIVQYTGTGAVRTVAHGLGAVPELIITKPTSGSGNWATYAAPVGPGSWLRLESTATPTSNTTTWNNTAPTSTVFSLGTGNQANFNGYTFIAYLFASLPGVSKVGSYTGTAASLNIDCGFTGGARFVLIKRTNAAGAWYVFDTTRGIVAGNEVYMALNEIQRDTSADWIAPLSSGFQLTANGSTTVNVNGGTYIFLAIA